MAVISAYKLVSPEQAISWHGATLLKKILLTLVLLFLISFGAGAQNTRPQVVGGVPAETRADLRQETFDIVWRTVKEKHFDPTLGGVDWDKVREQYAPRAAAAKTDNELYGILRQMLGELHQSHFNIIPPEAVVEDDSREPKGGSIGIDLRLIDGLPTITRVDPQSKAAIGGLRPGFVIKKIDDTTSDKIIETFAKSKEPQAMVSLRITRTFLSKINGAPDTRVRIAYLDEKDQLREVSVIREKLKGEMSERLGNFPPQYTEFETKRLADSIGYIRFNVFAMSLMERIKSAIGGMKDAPGIIIDLRGNPGGLGGMSIGIAGVLGKERTSLGTMHMRSGHQNFAVFPQANAYLGPLVILTDGTSASTSEIFAAGMQELGRAVVVGERTLGAALPSLFQKLPTGALFQFAIGDFRTPKGTLIEGQGVTPDKEVKLTRRALLEGRDPQLEAAIEQVRKQSKERKAVAARSTY
ncbi:MAG TPA: S41 family peptidase [Blastocatellia bacterium]|nr:S41 family peptidase [Blastocatellia bacterium]